MLEGTTTQMLLKEFEKNNLVKRERERERLAHLSGKPKADYPYLKKTRFL